MESCSEGDRSGGILLWDSARGGTRDPGRAKRLHQSLSWRGDNKLLASGSEDAQIIVWNWPDGFPLATMSKAQRPRPRRTLSGDPAACWASVHVRRPASSAQGRFLHPHLVRGRLAKEPAPGRCLAHQGAASFDGKLAIAATTTPRGIWDGKQLS